MTRVYVVCVSIHTWSLGRRDEHVHLAVVVDRDAIPQAESVHRSVFVRCRRFQRQATSSSDFFHPQSCAHHRQNLALSISQDFRRWCVAGQRVQRHQTRFRCEFCDIDPVSDSQFLPQTISTTLDRFNRVAGLCRDLLFRESSSHQPNAVADSGDSGRRAPEDRALSCTR